MLNDENNEVVVPSLSTSLCMLSGPGALHRVGMFKCHTIWHLIGFIFAHIVACFNLPPYIALYGA